MDKQYSVRMHPFVAEYLCYSLSLAIVNGVVMNVAEEVSVDEDSQFFGYVQRMGIATSYGKFILVSFFPT